MHTYIAKDKPRKKKKQKRKGRRKKIKRENKFHWRDLNQLPSQPLDYKYKYDTTGQT